MTSAGAVYGRLTVESVRSDGRRTFCVCACSCGSSKEIRADHLNAGKIRSCGCLNRELTAERSTTHGASMTSEYASWSHMKQRCLDPDSKDFYLYGARGVSVCDRWKISFADFLSDVGPKPSRRHSIDRIDNNGNYEPRNVRWATPIEQRRNQRRVVEAGWGVK